MKTEVLSPMIGKAFLNEAARLLELDLMPRLRSAVEQLSDEEVWWRPNQVSNSVGNLLLHLEGNARQWIISGIGGEPDRRCRSEEFSGTGPVSGPQLLDRLQKTLSKAVLIIRELDEKELAVVRSIQVYEITALQAVFHVVEHFSHHTGQVLYVVKSLKGTDLGFYDL